MKKRMQLFAISHSTSLWLPRLLWPADPKNQPEGRSLSKDKLILARLVDLLFGLYFFMKKGNGLDK